MLKLKSCRTPKGSLAQTLQFRSLIIVMPFLLGDPKGSPSKIAIEVHYVKYMGDKSDDTALVSAHDHFVPLLSVVVQ